MTAKRKSKQKAKSQACIFLQYHGKGLTFFFTSFLQLEFLSSKHMKMERAILYYTYKGTDLLST